jgi:ABC-type uncharacterized transport system substrate-binding protein
MKKCFNINKCDEIQINIRIHLTFYSLFNWSHSSLKQLKAKRSLIDIKFTNENANAITQITSQLKLTVNCIIILTTATKYSCDTKDLSFMTLT